MPAPLSNRCDHLEVDGGVTRNQLLITYTASDGTNPPVITDPAIAGTEYRLLMTAASR